LSISLHAFESGAVDNAHFHHVDHLRVAYELASHEPFDLALGRFMRGLRRIAAAAGDPSKVHMTISVAFLAAIAEREARDPARSWEEFRDRNPELNEKTFLGRWYSPEELESNVACRAFLLPRFHHTNTPILQEPR